MKHKIFFLLCVLLVSMEFGFSQQGVNYLKSEYDPDINDICARFRKQMAMDYDVAVKNLADIFQSLNFNKYKIEVVECSNIRSSALAYEDKSDNRKYMLINVERLRDVNARYYSHLFVVAHEFSHFYLNHFEARGVPTLSQLRQMELDADQNAASIVKQLGGTASDCKYALDLMNHPNDDTYADHPTKDKRYLAVDRGFRTYIDLGPNIHSNYKDIFPNYQNSSFLEYPNGINSYDLTYYSQKTGMYPKAVVYYNYKYYIYWKKEADLTKYSVFWNYETYPFDDVQKYLSDGYNFEFVEKMNGRWYVVLLKHNTAYGQYLAWIPKTDFYNKTGGYSTNILSYLDKGYSIQNLIDDGDNFRVLLTNYGSNGYYAYYITPNYPDFETWYKQKYNEGFNYMYTYKYINGGYFGFMQKSAYAKTWNTCHFDGYDASTLISNLNQGYAIDNIMVDKDYIRFNLIKQ